MKKQFKATKKIELIILGGFFIVVAVLSIATKLNHTNQSNPPIDESNWQLFSDSQTGISFLHPKNSPVQTSNSSGTEYSVWVPVLNLNYQYSVAESHKSATTFLLDIRATTYRPDYPNGAINDSFTTLAASDTVFPLFSSSGYNYVFLKSGSKQWQNQSFVLQCVKQNQCRAAIVSPNPQVAYLSVQISGIEGWRNGGNPIDFNSQNYRITQAIVESLKF